MGWRVVLIIFLCAGCFHDLPMGLMSDGYLPYLPIGWMGVSLQWLEKCHPDLYLDQTVK